jgi:hypothetical protein
LVFISKRWAKGFRIEDKDVEERKNIYVYVCAHIRKNRERERKGKKEKEKREEKRREKKKKERKIRLGKKDIMRDDKSSEDQDKCKEGCDDVENESSIFRTMCNPTSRTSLVP